MSVFSRHSNGDVLQYPVRVQSQYPGTAQGGKSLLWWQDHRRFFWYFEDFIWDTFDIDEHPLALYDASASGTPTKDIIADATGGAFQIKLASTNEAETVALTMNDQLYIRMNKPWFWEARMKTVHTMAANQQLVWGIGSDMDTDTLDNIARNAWFREETDTDLMIEADDATTDEDDIDTGHDVTADTYYIYSIEHTEDGRLIYRKSDGDGQNIKSFKLTTETRAFGANNGQPIFVVRKSTGTTQPEINIDYFGFMGTRV